MTICLYLTHILFIFIYRYANLTMIEGSLEAKLTAIWTDEKHRQEETRTWRKSEGRR